MSRVWKASVGSRALVGDTLIKQSLHLLGEIGVPTLVLGGRCDETTPTVTGTVHRGIRGFEWVIFEHSAHTPHLEEPERYLQVLTTFLERVESSPTGVGS